MSRDECECSAGWTGGGDIQLLRFKRPGAVDDLRIQENSAISVDVWKGPAPMAPASTLDANAPMDGKEHGGFGLYHTGIAQYNLLSSLD